MCHHVWCEVGGVCHHVWCEVGGGGSVRWEVEGIVNGEVQAGCVLYTV